MKKFALLSILVVAVLVAVGVIADAQQPGKLSRIGILFIGGRDQPNLESFKQGLRDLGYTKVKILSSNTATLKATKTDLAILPLSWYARKSMFSSPLRRIARWPRAKSPKRSRSW